MKTRALGSTGLVVSEIGLGCAAFEYRGRSLERSDVVAAIRYAFDNGITYFDLPLTIWREAAGEALKGIRNDVVLSGHLGCCPGKDDSYVVSRDVTTCADSFHAFLKMLGTDHVDVLFLFCVDGDDSLAISTHVASTAMKAIDTGRIDAVMFPVNPAHDLLPGDAGPDAYYAADSFRPASGQLPPAHQDRRQLYQACLEKGVGLIAMKVYAGGLLLEKGRFIGGEAPAGTRSAMSLSLTEARCISYALSQPGVSIALPGCTTVDEVKTALSYVNASPEERDYSAIDSNALWKMSGRCVYCNHCLPCPVGIEIGSLIRLLDAAERAKSDQITTSYRALRKNASACTGCGDCTERCPFGVPVVERMERAVDVLGVA
jgi:predicted aldo/keto reductase-like oxidoreductase